MGRNSVVARLCRSAVMVAAVALLSGGVGLVVAGTVAAQPPTPPTGVPVTPSKIETPNRSSNGKAGPEIVEVGEYLNDVLNIDFDGGTFTADFYIWLNWRGKIDPTHSLEFTNTEGALSRFEPTTATPTRLPDGSFNQCWHVQGRFTTDLDFRPFPRDPHVLGISFEDNRYPASQLAYRVAPPSYSHEFAELPDGWKLSEPPSARSVTHAYDTDFGIPSDSADGAHSAYSQVAIDTHISKPITGYLLQAILPITTVVAIVLVVYFLPAANSFIRIMAASLAFVTAVNLRNALFADLPNITYFVLFDTLFLVSYLIFLVSVVHTVVVIRLSDTGRDQLIHRLTVGTVAASAVVFIATVCFVLVV